MSFWRRMRKETPCWFGTGRDVVFYGGQKCAESSCKNLAEVCGNRTHQRQLKPPLTGFEARARHQTNLTSENVKALRREL